MKRITVRPAILLLLGAMLNVLAAWGIAYATDTQKDPPTWPRCAMRSPYPYVCFIARADYHPGFSRVVVRQYSTIRSTINPDRSMVYEPVEDVLPSWAYIATWDKHDSLTQMYDACGWPMHAMTGGMQFRRSERDIRDRQRQPNLPPFVIHSLTLEHAFILSNDARNNPYVFIYEPDIVPLRPLWPGFAVNTVFYAAMLWMIFVMPLKFRRWRRIRKHRCPNCAYQLEGSTGTGCSECGWNRDAEPQT